MMKMQYLEKNNDKYLNNIILYYQIISVVHLNIQILWLSYALLKISIFFVSLVEFTMSGVHEGFLFFIFLFVWGCVI